MRQDKRSSPLSFTLIELIIVVAVLILFSGLSAAYYNQFTEQLKLSGETKKVIDILELAKRKATSGDVSSCSSSPPITPQVEKYSVTVNGASTYKLSPNCTAGTAIEVNYQTGTNITFPTPTLSVDFKPLAGGATQSCFVIKNISSEKCRYVRVESSGTICEDSCSSCGVGGCPCTPC